MWNKLSLRVKITVIITLTLTVLCTGLTAAAILNTSVFYEPFAYVLDRQPIDDGFVTERHPNSVKTIGAENSDTIQTIDEIYIGSFNQFRAVSILTAVGVIVAGAFLTWFLAGRTLGPLRAFADQVEQIDENTLGEELRLPPSSSEVTRLTDSFNRMTEKLDRSFRSKKLFASHAAHELKTPLTNILTNIEVMQMDDSPNAEEYREVVEITKENVERLTVLIQDLLYFNAEPDSGNFEAIQSDSIIGKILEDLSLSILEKKINVHIDGQTTIHGDRNLLELAFSNLIQNAVRYNRENGDIFIRADKDMITIEDTGIGVPEESLPLIFDPFYCVDRSRSRQLGGSGLGLSIAKQIFDKHNIRITASGAPGEGTTIRLKLPPAP